MTNISQCQLSMTNISQFQLSMTNINQYQLSMTNIRGTIKNNPKMNEGAGCWPPPDLGQVPDGLGRESHQDCHRRGIRHHFPAVISARYTRRGRRWATLLKNCMLSLDYYLISIAVVQFQVDRHKRCDLCILCFRQSMVYYSTTATTTTTTTTSTTTTVLLYYYKITE